MVSIRQASEKDIPTIEFLLSTKVAELKANGIEQWGPDEISWKNLRQAYQPENFYIAYLEGEPVGCFCVVDYDPTYWKNDAPHTSLYIHKVVVLNKASKQGISDQLLDHFKELGRQQGVPSVKLDVRAHKDKLRAFYERNEFKLVEVADLEKGYLTALYEYKL